MHVKRIQKRIALIMLIMISSSMLDYGSLRGDYCRAADMLGPGLMTEKGNAPAGGDVRVFNRSRPIKSKGRKGQSVKEVIRSCVFIAFK